MATHPKVPKENRLKQLSARLNLFCFSKTVRTASRADEATTKRAKLLQPAGHAEAIPLHAKACMIPKWISELHAWKGRSNQSPSPSSSLYPVTLFGHEVIQTIPSLCSRVLHARPRSTINNPSSPSSLPLPSQQHRLQAPRLFPYQSHSSSPVSSSTTSSLHLSPEPTLR